MLLKAAANVCRSTKKRQWRKETWGWHVAVNSAVNVKWRCGKTWKKGGSKEEYQMAKRLAKHAVYLEKNPWLTMKSSMTLHPAALTFSASLRQMRRENLDVQGKKPVCNDAGKLGMDDKSAQAAWKEHYERLKSGVRLGPGLPQRSLPRKRPSPQHPT